MRSRIVSLLILFVSAGVFAFGCGGDNPQDPVTGYFEGDYQINAYLGNEPFWVSDVLYLDRGGFGIAISRMRETAAEPGQATVLLDKRNIIQNPFPLTTTEQAIYSWEGKHFNAGSRHELEVWIGDLYAKTTITVPAQNDVAIVRTRKVYFRNDKLRIRWRYDPGTTIPELVELIAVDNLSTGTPGLSQSADYRVTLPGDTRSHTLSGAVTQNFSNDLGIQISIFDEYFWDFDSSLSLFPGSRVYFVNPYDVAYLTERCHDKDWDGYGSPASTAPPCSFGLLDCDDTNANVSPGGTEGPIGDISCGDHLDNNCNGLIDAADPGCKV